MCHEEPHTRSRDVHRESLSKHYWQLPRLLRPPASVAANPSHPAPAYVSGQVHSCSCLQQLPHHHMVAKPGCSKQWGPSLLQRKKLTRGL